MTSPATSHHGPIQTLIQFYAIVEARIFDTVQKLNQSIVPVVVGTYLVRHLLHLLCSTKWTQIRGSSTFRFERSK